MITLEQGKRLIKLARGSISCYFSGEEVKIDDVKKEFSEVLGVFVTLNKGGELRGCIGFPEGIFPLYEGVVKAARNAAFSDPRFVPVEKEELKDISIEVSVLTKPDRVNVEKAEDYVKEIKVGRDGLIVKGLYGSGLLLPQVATEYRWDSKMFLEQTCVKAGLDRDYYKDLRNCVVFRFQSQVFSEVKPEGKVIKLL